jgi:intein/homing endonuclease
MYAQVVKHRKKGRVVEVSRSVVFGKKKEVEKVAQGLKKTNGRKGKINTAYVERNNLTLRQDNGRLSRKTLAFSKNRRELQYQLDFWSAYANFVKPHGALKITTPVDSTRKWLLRTPAIASGITDHIWTFKELLCYRC